MIQDFHIKNFRHFHDIKIKDLKRINLFVGKNSAGKSALLEALLLFFTQMSEEYISKIHNARNERFNRKSPSNTNPLRHLFINHVIPKPGLPGITLSSKNDPRSLELKVMPYSLHRDSSGFVESYSLFEDDIFDPVDPFNDSEDFFVIKKGSNHYRVARLDMDEQEYRRFSRKTPKNNIENCQFIPTDGLDETETSTLWDQIALTGHENNVIRALQLIEPKVTAVAFIGGEYRDSRTPMVKLEGEIEPVPLKSLGDGMRKIFQIVLSLANAKDGALLIDEFENGLHWSVQEDVWKIIFEMSLSLNVQIFATSHSRDCIKSFEEAWTQDKNAGAFMRLSKNQNSEISITKYSLDLLQDSLETDVEVR